MVWSTPPSSMNLGSKALPLNETFAGAGVLVACVSGAEVGPGEALAAGLVPGLAPGEPVVNLVVPPGMPSCENRRSWPAGSAGRNARH